MFKILLSGFFFIALVFSGTQEDVIISEPPSVFARTGFESPQFVDLFKLPNREEHKTNEVLPVDGLSQPILPASWDQPISQAPAPPAPAPEPSPQPTGAPPPPPPPPPPKKPTTSQPSDEEESNNSTESKINDTEMRK